ncbi:MAG: FAD-dependent monooxygenase, partial [Candidatus Eremiobacteraeota bacterium]|nr:FAD-dependent monooxygenase [Candidatus Eremiobacteraeota bacterium]
MMKTAVLVVGAGPVGLTAAIELARYGVSVRIVDKLPKRSDKSKALAMWARTLELFDRAGVSDSLIAAGIEATGSRMFAGGRQIGEVTLDHLASVHPYVLLVTQDETERVLEEHLASLGVVVERGVALTTFDDNDERIAATLLGADGTVDRLDTDWLVACDGAHSGVRHALGKPFDGTTVATDFVLADVHLAGSTEISRTRISMFAHADGLLLLFPIGRDRFRVIADLGDATGEHPPDPTLESVQTLIDARGPGGITVHDSLWLSAFRINERQVEDYRAGRVFLAGDAAHVHSPAGGQGMNTGMQDACNLAWKLALVVEGGCSSKLLSTYDSERRPVAREMIAETSKLSAVMTMNNPVLQSVRNHAIALLLGLPAVRLALADRLSELTIGYPDSVLTHAAGRANGGPRPGARAPARGGERPAGSGAA